MPDTLIKPELSSLLWLPTSLLTKRRWKAVEEALTFEVSGYEGSENRVTETFVFDEERGAYGLPVQYGLKLLQKTGGLAALAEVEKKVTQGYTITTRRLPDPHHEAAPDGQDAFFEETLDAVLKYPSALAVAPTGSGKTVAVCYLIGRLRRTSLVVVPSIEVADHWRDELKLHLGLTDSEIGRVDDGKCYYRGCKVVVAVIHTLVLRRFSASFKDYFGFVAWDEGHRLGADRFSRSMRVVRARYRVAVTATPDRRDGCFGIVTDYFGKPKVMARYDALPCEVRVVPFSKRVEGWHEMSAPALINYLVRIKSRNRLGVKLIKRMFDEGRNIIVSSDRVRHLMLLMKLCRKAGIPADVMGLHVRSYPVKIEGKTCTRTKSTKDLKEIREKATIIFTTFGMGKESLNIRRMDGGLDMSPRADGTQMIGRIRRPFAGKQHPVWYTINDVRIPKFAAFTQCRIRDYIASKATVTYERE